MHIGTIITRAYRRVFVFIPKCFSLAMSRVNLQIHSLTLDGASWKTEIPRYTLKHIWSTIHLHNNYSYRDFCSPCPCHFVAFVIKPFVFRHQWDQQLYIHLIRLHTSSPCCSVTMCALQDHFVLECHQVVFYCNFSSSMHVSKRANLIGRPVFKVEHQTKKTSQRCKKTTTFLHLVFCASVCTLTLTPFV